MILRKMENKELKIELYKLDGEIDRLIYSVDGDEILTDFNPSGNPYNNESIIKLFDILGYSVIIEEKLDDLWDKINDFED